MAYCVVGSIPRRMLYSGGLHILGNVRHNPEVGVVLMNSLTFGLAGSGENTAVISTTAA